MLLGYRLKKLGLTTELPRTPQEWRNFERAMRIAGKSKDNL